MRWCLGRQKITEKLFWWRTFFGVGLDVMEKVAELSKHILPPRHGAMKELPLSPLLALLEHRQKHASLIKPIFFRRLAVSLSDFLPKRLHTRSRHMWIINHKISSKTFMSSGFFLAYTHTHIIILYPSPLRIINYVIFPGNERSGKLIVPPSEIGKKVYCLAYRGGWVAGNGGKFSSSDCQQTVNRLSTFFLHYLSARSFSSFLFN